MMKHRILIIVGPTGVGKTALSLSLARELKHIEIISADSRQVYRLMNIGTAKPTVEELARVPHHFIDIKNPNEYYSAGKYGREARLKISQLIQQQKMPVIVGGSGLYIRALVDGFFDRQISDPQVRTRLKGEMIEKGTASLYDRLCQVDPVTAQKIHPNDGHRIVRALEVYELTGESLSEIQNQGSQKADFDPIFIGLDRERKKLYQTIEQRVDKMIDRGLVEEVKYLRQLGYHSNLNSMQTVGYREVNEYLDQKIEFETMVRLIKQHTRNYAKRQLTWFRKDQRIRWLDPGDDLDWHKLLDLILKFGK